MVASSGWLPASWWQTDLGEIRVRVEENVRPHSSPVSWLGLDDLPTPPMVLLGFLAQRGTKLNILLASLLDQEQHGIGGFVESFCQPTSR